MKKLRLFAAVMSFCLASSLASCSSSNDAPDSSVIVNTDNAAQNGNNNSGANDQNEPEMPVIGGTDANGYTVTGVVVTDNKGEKVTDKAGTEVTEMAVVDNKGNIVTDPQGNNVKPQMNTSNSNSNSNNNSSNNNYINESEAMQSIEEFKDNTPSSSAKGTNSVLWITSLTHTVTSVSAGKTVSINQIQEVEGNGDLFTITFKIADDAPDGNYEVKFGRPSSSSSLGSFCGEYEMNYNVNYYNGNITVGSVQTPEEQTPQGIACSLENVSASAGSEVVMTCRMSGVSGLAAFNTYFTYDSQYLKVTSINAGNVIAGKGDFMCQ